MRSAPKGRGVVARSRIRLSLSDFGPLLVQFRNPITDNPLSIMHEEGLSERLRLRITPKLEERLKTWAERNDTSVSAYVRQALEEKINEEILSDIDRKL